MALYIKKDALVVEIEKKIKQYKNERNTIIKDTDNLKELSSRIIMCQEIISFLDTLEVKEVVDAEIVEVKDNNNSIYAYTRLEICTDEDLSKICKAGDKAKVIIIK